MYAIDISTGQGKAAAAALQSIGAALTAHPRQYIIRENGETVIRHTFEDAIPSLGLTAQEAHCIILTADAGSPIPEPILKKTTPEAIALLIVAYKAAHNILDIQHDLKTHSPLVEITRGGKRYTLPSHYTPEQIEQTIAHS